MKILNYNEILDRVKSSEYIIIDDQIIGFYPEIQKKLQGKIVYNVVSPEESKNIDAFFKISQFFLENGISRAERILVIGGGATSDLGGFVCSTLLRGIDWEVIPTTLLAMIDAAIGGKTGINTVEGKNLIGSFHHPISIDICTDFLKTLPDVEMMSGYGEMLKYAFLDKGIYRLILENGPLDKVILACGKLKQNIVENDFKESGKRKILNFGHTLGHAIEKCLNIPHGIAVLFGIEFIIKLYSPHLYPEFSKIRSKLNLSDDLNLKINYDRFMDYLSYDKKKMNKSEIELILIDDIGKYRIELTSFDDIEKRLKSSDLYERYFK